jgi:hypothetical protein
MEVKEPRAITSELFSYLRHGRWNGEGRPKSTLWWTGHTEGKLRLFITCWNCAHIIQIDNYYVVHPQGYLYPCVKCRDCGHEAHRRFMDWKPMKIFTGSHDWKNRERLLKVKFNMPRESW